MVLEKLGTSLKETLKKIAEAVFVNDKLIEELVREIQRALLQADVNVQLVFKLSESIKQRALKEKTPETITKKEHLIKIVYEELVRFLGEHKQEIKITKRPTSLMLVGLFGSGKTTTSGKLAYYYAKRGHKVALIGLDVHRPAAAAQLEQLGKKINVPTYVNKTEKNAVKIYHEFEKEYTKYDLLIFDTAGRDALSEDLIKEIETINHLIKPEERLLVISADIGQAAQRQAEQFHKSCQITGIIVTKLDGTGKGGGALSACNASGAPITFIGTGEKLDDIETFNPQGFVSRLLGMGDLEALLEKAKEALDENQVKDLSKKVLQGEFNLVDLYDQIQAMNKMGPLNKILDLIPGMGNVGIPKEALAGQEEKIKYWKILMNSMTKGELEDPDIITPQRMERIAKGSGRSVGEIRELLKQYKQSKKMMKLLKGEKNPDMNKLMKKMGKFKK
ncbi:MAG TPA: signal recognition particle protein Srp54 [Candidatus Nanoarchaeia archaeon]|nr:signal recognition particle protein Srp54 [Candidatus Nanoarchaeia archaeon]